MKELIYTHFPYCIKCVGKNEYIVLNRDYKPLGINTWVDDYSVHPSVIKIRLTKQQAARLSFDKSDDLECVYLFKSTPELLSDKKEFANYMSRLELLASLKAKGKDEK